MGEGRGGKKKGQRTLGKCFGSKNPSIDNRRGGGGTLSLGARGKKGDNGVKQCQAICRQPNLKGDAMSLAKKGKVETFRRSITPLLLKKKRTRGPQGRPGMVGNLYLHRKKRGSEIN